MSPVHEERQTMSHHRRGTGPSAASFAGEGSGDPGTRRRVTEAVCPRAEGHFDHRLAVEAGTRTPRGELLVAYVDLLETLADVTAAGVDSSGASVTTRHHEDAVLSATAAGSADVHGRRGRRAGNQQGLGVRRGPARRDPHIADRQPAPCHGAEAPRARRHPPERTEGGSPSQEPPTASIHALAREQESTKHGPDPAA